MSYATFFLLDSEIYVIFYLHSYNTILLINLHPLANHVLRFSVQQESI